MDTTQGIVASPNLARRSANAASWLIPGALLALLPKCPMCLAAYIAMFSGVALPFSTASFLRYALIGACITSLVYVAIRKSQRYFVSRFRA